ncbi:hypothetical protein ACES2L_07075 [Bdellovibrio bacteriovorus]
MNIEKKTFRYIILLPFLVVGLLIAIAGFNYFRDPLCYFHCETVDLNKQTHNVYYQAAQTLAANPDAEVLILGSSRGERVAPKWVEKLTTKKTVNLSQGGADLILKVALSNQALESHKNLKLVIWMADYFELLPHTTDTKVHLTPVLYNQVSSTVRLDGFQKALRTIKVLVDHNTLEAAVSLNKAEKFRQTGNGSEIDPEICVNPILDTDKKLQTSYPSVHEFLKMDQNEDYFKILEEQIRKFESRGIKVIINVSPYHPQFEERLFAESPASKLKIQAWIDRLSGLKSDMVTVLDFSGGIPGDDGGLKYWEDGIHPTCYSEVLMLDSALKSFQ